MRVERITSLASEREYWASPVESTHFTRSAGLAPYAVRVFAVTGELLASFPADDSFAWVRVEGTFVTAASDNTVVAA